MINRHVTRALYQIAQFSWRFWIVCCCTGWCLTYQIVTWHEHHEAHEFEQQIARLGLPPMQMLNSAAADTPVRLAPASSHLEFATPAQYFRYMDTRLHMKNNNTPGRTR